MAKRGDTFLCTSGPERDPTRRHLYVILTEPHGPAQQVLTVSICTLTDPPQRDAHCVIEAGAHHFITARSYASFAHVRQICAADIDARLRTGEYVAKAPLAASIVERMAVEMLGSDFVKPFATDFYFEWLESLKKLRTR